MFKVRSYHLVLVGKQWDWQLPALFCRSQRPPWLMSHRKVAHWHWDFCLIIYGLWEYLFHPHRVLCSNFLFNLNFCQFSNYWLTCSSTHSFSWLFFYPFPLSISLLHLPFILFHPQNPPFTLNSLFYYTQRHPAHCNLFPLSPGFHTLLSTQSLLHKCTCVNRRTCSVCLS